MTRASHVCSQEGDRDRWKTHKNWSDRWLLERLKQAVRRDDGIIKEFSDGTVFPILSALSRVVKQKSGHWRARLSQGFCRGGYADRSVAAVIATRWSPHV